MEDNMKTFFTYWVVWVVTFITMDIPLELGGWGIWYHQNLSGMVMMFGFFVCLIVASAATLVFGSSQQ